MCATVNHRTLCPQQIECIRQRLEGLNLPHWQEAAYEQIPAHLQSTRIKDHLPAGTFLLIPTGAIPRLYLEDDNITQSRGSLPPSLLPRPSMASSYMAHSHDVTMRYPIGWSHIEGTSGYVLIEDPHSPVHDPEPPRDRVIALRDPSWRLVDQLAYNHRKRRLERVR